MLRAGAVVLVLLAAATASWLIVRDSGRGAAADEAQRLDAVAAALAEGIRADTGELAAVAGLFDAPPRAGAQRFAAAGARVLRRRPALDAVLYAQADPADRIPIAWAATREESAVPGPPGTDLGADPARMDAIRLARDTGVTQASRPVSVLGGSGRAIALVAPAYEGGVTPVGVAARRRAIRGYAVAVLRLDHLEQALAAALPPGPGYAVRDIATASPLVTVDAGPRAATRVVAVAGRRWEVAVAGVPRGIPPLAVVAAVAGVALAALLAAGPRRGRPGRRGPADRTRRAAILRDPEGV